MKLTWRVHHVRALQWGGRTRLEAGALTVSKDDLERELLEDERITGVDFHLAGPGESCRILPLFDVVEPRAKIEPRGADFPGVLGPVTPVGMGQTRVLRGMAVDVLDPEPIPSRIAVLDLRAPFDDRYTRLHHLIAIPHLKQGLDINDRRNALRLAGLRAAVALAQHVEGEPDEEQTFELTQAGEDLPRVAYVCQLHSHQRPTVPGEGLLYGDNCRHLLPTIVHPNDVLDGAVLRAYDSMAMETWSIQNHALILDLYRRHGHDLDFAGVVVNVANQLVEERDRCTVLTANLVKYALQAKGAIFTKSGGGAPHVDMALAAERCEELGVKTTLLAWDLTSTDDGTEGAQLFSSPLLDAIVSLGSNNIDVALPAAERVIAPSAALAERYQGDIASPALRTVGVMDQLGGSRFTAAFY
jgi:sarcosine reductase